ncbi:unnamed protein product [Protopolystoma xenopodis]|uniref:Uncharacterized protein n=1 Tax=Protopolystoma xenopodis TaxID=117903 RepID=A0A448XLG1_9PLAT|nr:unnamed protein product [Protopolystoma xenopodis]
MAENLSHFEVVATRGKQPNALFAPEAIALVLIVISSKWPALGIKVVPRDSNHHDLTYEPQTEMVLR